jgi:hypothetical protein
VRYYLERRDPAFERRMAEVIEVYGAAEMVRGLAPNERPVAIVSYDEKPGIQAIATTAPELEPKPDKHPTVQRDHEYKRLGTVTLAAAVDLVTGIVHHAVTQRHRSREFVAFLQMLDAAYPLGSLICVLLDNHSAHKSKETRGFLALHPGRFELVFTPHPRFMAQLRRDVLFQDGPVRTAPDPCRQQGRAGQSNAPIHPDRRSTPRCA